MACSRLTLRTSTPIAQQRRADAQHDHGLPQQAWCRTGSRSATDAAARRGSRSPATRAAHPERAVRGEHGQRDGQQREQRPPGEAQSPGLAAQHQESERLGGDAAQRQAEQQTRERRPRVTRAGGSPSSAASRRISQRRGRQQRQPGEQPADGNGPGAEAHRPARGHARNRNRLFADCPGRSRKRTVYTQAMVANSAASVRAILLGMTTSTRSCSTSSDRGQPRVREVILDRRPRPPRTARRSTAPARTDRGTRRRDPRDT